jgi:protein-L-isoaspartate(D-aspartate) O-methyltransferase
MDAGNDPYAAARERMIEGQLRARGIVMHRVIEAMREVPRHLFVGRDQQEKAYADEALPAREGQTISQPYIVAVMVQELDVREEMWVLEVGTGTGYQTAVLSRLVGENGRVYTVERIPGVAEAGRRRLEAMDIKNVRYFVGDGSAGWPGDLLDGEGEAEPARFDRILVAAGAPRVPDPLVNELKIGGIMVLPIGDEAGQVLRRVVKLEDGHLEERDFGSCRFVPLVGAFGWKEAAVKSGQ